MITQIILQIYTSAAVNQSAASAAVNQSAILKMIKMSIDYKFIILTFLAICPSESKVTCTSKTPIRFADAHAIPPTHIGGDEVDPTHLRTVRLKGDGTTVYH